MSISDQIQEIIRIQQEHNLIDAIIDIYNGKYRTYLDYLDDHQPFDFVLSTETFEYIKEKRNERN